MLLKNSNSWTKKWKFMKLNNSWDKLEMSKLSSFAKWKKHVIMLKECWRWKDLEFVPFMEISLNKQENLYWIISKSVELIFLLLLMWLLEGLILRILSMWLTMISQCKLRITFIELVEQEEQRLRVLLIHFWPMAKTNLPENFLIF